MLAKKENIRNRIKRFRARFAKLWRAPARDFFEKRFDEQLQFVNEVEATKDDLFTYHGPEPEPTTEELVGMDTEKMMNELKEWSPLVLYKYSKRLEKLTKILIWLTVFLAILTFVLMILSIYRF